ncbi:MAG TPA: hypothetical protein PL082_09610, partial [Tepidiformaceae bacterium]|nr:hypothetical protein [Tepidiformaceae bacterium]
EQLFEQQLDKLNEIYQSLPEGPAAALEPQLPPPPGGAARDARTDLPAEFLVELNKSLLRMPENFTVNRKLARTFERRHDIFKDPGRPAFRPLPSPPLAHRDP